ncbi:MAG: Ni/Fe hydrogenase subunit alpha [Promethearchaeati archaeon SRVP18_Atabeyarchaeia-1]
MKRSNGNIEIEYLPRIEGHGAITVELDESGGVGNVKVDIPEAPRLFEALVRGKTPDEDLNMVPRVCGICSFSHKYAGIRAFEKALGVTPSEKAIALRTLLHLSETLQSNVLHVFFLSLPDLLGYPNAIEMASDYKDAVLGAMKMKGFANKIMEIGSGRFVHGENPVIGGFGRYPTDQELAPLKSISQELIPQAEKAAEMIGEMEIPVFPERDTTFMCLNPPTGEYGLVGDNVLISDGKEIPVENYKQLTNERVVSHSFAKRSRYNGKPFTVGAIARINLLGDRLQGVAKKYYEKYYSGRWKKNPMFNIHAQALEILWTLQAVYPIVDAIAEAEEPEEPIAKRTKATGKGSGAVEAPRGILYHHYEVENGLIKNSDIITPTAQNLDDIEEFIKVTAANLISSGDNDDIQAKLEMVARAFDPCVSCSVHLVRKRSEKHHQR